MIEEVKQITEDKTQLKELLREFIEYYLDP